MRLSAKSIATTSKATCCIDPSLPRSSTLLNLAQNGAFPVFAAQVSSKSHTPVRAVLAQGVCSMLMTFTSFPQLVVFIGFTLTVFTTLAVGSVFLFRRGPWRPLASVTFAYPLLPVAYCLLGAGTAVYGLIWQPKASVAALIVIGAGALVYHLTFGARVKRDRTAGRR